MKKIYAVVGFFILLSLNVSAQAKRVQDIAGRWEFTGEENAGATLDIIDSSTIILTYQGDTRKITNIKMDFSKSPSWFDFTTKDTSSLVNIKSLIEIVGENMMKWQLFIDEERTPYFSAKKGEVLYLRRTKPTTATASN